MRILLWHGYLLSGSGSNLYTANLARIWRRAGHDVLLMCQERRAEEFQFVDAKGEFASDNRSFDMSPTGADPGPGRVSLLRPNIGEVLPVYVYDAYEGFQAKRFVDLSEEELEHYTSANIRALVTAIEDHEPDVVITGHEVMGPYIAKEARARTRAEYLAKLHGSALEYAVKEQERYQDFMREGLSTARVVVGGSNYMIKEAASVVGGWEERASVVNPGCDVNIFRPRERDPNAPPTVGYVGKFIVSKGVHNLLCALGLTKTKSLRTVVVGYGGFEKQLHEVWSALRTGDEELLETLAIEGDGEPLTHVLDLIDSGDFDSGYRKRAGDVTVEFPGRLEHGPLSHLLPTFDVLVVPSILAEAFGMVAAEAAACGVLPIVPRHSGIGEVGAVLEEGLERPGLLTYDPDDPIRGIARSIDGVLSLSPSERSVLGKRAAALAYERWSWEHVAEQLLALASEG